MYSFENVVLNGAGEFAAVRALALRHQRVVSQQNSGGGIDGHRRGNVLQRDVLEETLHVGQGGNRHADAAHLAGGHRMVAVVAHLGGQIEGDRESSGALREQVTIAPVAFLGGAEAGVLAHGPQAAAVHLAVDAAGVRELTRVAETIVHDRFMIGRSYGRARKK